MTWCQGVPQARTPWRAPLLGHRAGRGGGQWVIGLLRAGGLCHFCVCPWAARSRCAPVVAMRHRFLGGVAVLQLGWQTPWCTGPVSRVVNARVRDRCHRPSLPGGGVAGAVPPPFAQAFGRPRAPVAVCPWRVVPPIAGRPLTLGGRWRMSWMLRLPPGGGPREALPVNRAQLA